MFFRVSMTHLYREAWLFDPFHVEEDIRLSTLEVDF